MKTHEIIDSNVWIKEKQVIQVSENIIENNLRNYFETDRNALGEIQNFAIKRNTNEIQIKEKYYLKGKFLGSGGYAECYQVETINERKEKQKYACKIIKKVKLDDDRRKKKVEAELQIHKILKHKHIVEFKHFFEDQENIYILMELCEQFSLQDLITQRSQIAENAGAKCGYQGLSEIEVRYFMSQIISAMEYLHSEDLMIIHRDLSLKNIFIGNNFDSTM